MASFKERKLKVLTVCKEISKNKEIHNKPIAEFIFEQNEALQKLDVDFDYYLIKRGGLKGYLFHSIDFLRFLKTNNFKYNIIHAHGGHLGTLANIQRKTPVVTTYHGSDINMFLLRLISLYSLIFSRKNIFVSTNLQKKVKYFTKGDVIPCGVDFDIFRPFDKIQARLDLGFNLSQKIVLFGGQKNRGVKNFPLAKKVSEVAKIDNLIELKGFSREKVVKLINACDCLLLTSFSEGSPMIIKEALVCNCPIVSVDVGDIKEITKGLSGVFLSDYNPYRLAQSLNKAIDINRTSNRNSVKFLDNKIIAKQVLNIYLEIFKAK